MAIQRLHTNHRMSQIVIHQNMVYLAGQVAADDDLAKDAAEQTRSTLAEIENCWPRRVPTRPTSCR